VFKVGPSLFISGADVIRTVKDMGASVFLDIKLFDIPNTVRQTVESAAGLGVDMLTLQ
jgi:orotidine-5'-phosphate decarboxylase